MMMGGLFVFLADRLRWTRLRWILLLLFAHLIFASRAELYTRGRPLRQLRRVFTPEAFATTEGKIAAFTLIGAGLLFFLCLLYDDES
jgi:hypothetical protein